MRVYCNTNLDLKNESWPEQLPGRPVAGDLVESKTRHGRFQLSLEVVRCKWIFSDFYGWCLDVELHDAQNRSIRAFYEWYAPLVNLPVNHFV